jgi:hypothetical protein
MPVVICRRVEGSFVSSETSLFLFRSLYVMWVITRGQVMLKVLYITYIPFCGFMNSCGRIFMFVVCVLYMLRLVWRYHFFLLLNFVVIPVL